jgi:hypothetical protein
MALITQLGLGGQRRNWGPDDRPTPVEEAEARTGRTRGAGLALLLLVLVVLRALRAVWR